MNSTQPIHPFFSYALVFLQFALIGLLILNADFTSNNLALMIQALAVFIGLWALKTMHLGHFNIIPDPMPDIQLVTTGPYQFIRHPMYLSILLFFFPMVILDISMLNLGLFVNLFFILFIKLSYEEYLLTQTLGDYAEYQSRTKKLIPYIL